MGTFSGILAGVSMPCFVSGPLELGLPVIGFSRYVSARRGGGPDATSDTLRAMKEGLATPEEIQRLARRLAPYVPAGRVIPMPRRAPGVGSDLAPLVAALHEIRPDLIDGTGALIRTALPEGGVLHERREHFTPEAHAKTFSVVRRKIAGHKKFVILDNVLTMGGSMAGAFLAMREVVEPEQLVGVALTAVDNWSCTRAASSRSRPGTVPLVTTRPLPQMSVRM